MATLGDLLASSRRSAARFQGWVEAADPEFAEDVKAVAARSGDSLAGFARAAVADFDRFADEEAWARLTRIIRDDEDPGMACLIAMIRWRMAQEGCVHHSVLSGTGDR